MDTELEAFTDRATWLSEQGRKLEADIDSCKKKNWENIETLMRDTQLFPEYTKEKHHLHYDQHLRALIVCDGCSDNAQLAKMLLGALLK